MPEFRKNPFPKRYPCYCGNELMRHDAAYTCLNKKCYRHTHAIHGAIRTGYDEFDIGVPESDQDDHYRYAFTRGSDNRVINLIKTKLHA